MAGNSGPHEDRCVVWILVAALNTVVAICYVIISVTVGRGLLRTKQFRSNPLAVATSAIFLTCAAHHGHHALHLVIGYGGPHDALNQYGLTVVRSALGDWHSVIIDIVSAVVAVTYVGLRRSYGALLNTPAMFEDAVRVAAEAHLADLAFTDKLTGVPNRAAYQDFADAQANRTQDAAVLFIDLDGLKDINDLNGHDAGDRVLHDVALRLSSSLHPSERMFRLGGDEFIVVGLGHDPERADELARRAERVIAEPTPLREGFVRVAASVGVAHGGAERSIEQLLREADMSMYAIKRRGRLPAPRRGIDSGVAH